MTDGPVVAIGHVERAMYAPGSKSEHVALLLVTETGERFELRRRGATPFHEDPVLATLVGARVEVEGSVYRDVLLFDRCTPTGPEGSPPPDRAAPVAPPPSSHPAQRQHPR